jgi:hypothetical protein
MTRFKSLLAVADLDLATRICVSPCCDYIQLCEYGKPSLTSRL